MGKIFPTEIIVVGGGGGAPTVTYTDDLGFYDTDSSLAWTLGDTIGEKDLHQLGWTYGDDVGWRDSDMILNMGLGDTTGWQDKAYSLAATMVDDIGFKDTNPQTGWTLGDTEGMKDNASITGTGTPQLIAVVTNAQASTVSSFGINIPASRRAGDLLLVIAGGDTGIANSGPHVTSAIDNESVGWSPVTPDVGLDPGTVQRLFLRGFWKISDGTETAVAINFQNPSDHSCGEVYVIRGVNASAPINVNAAASVAASSLTTNPVGPSITTTVANCMIFQTLYHYHAALTNSHTPPSGYIERTDFEATNTGTIASLTTDTEILGTAGATGTATHTCTETVATDAMMIAFAVAPGSISINL